MSFTSWEKTICNICIYTYKKLIHLLGWECFLLCTTGNFRIQRHLHYYVGIFYQFLYTNQYFLNTTLILSHTTLTHTQTHTHTHTRTRTLLRVPFLFLNFCLSKLEFGYLNNLKYLIEWWKLASEKKGQDENSHKQLGLKYVPFTFINHFIISILDPM